MLACDLQQKAAMSSLGNPACLDVCFPRPIGHNQSDFWMSGNNRKRLIRTRVIIGDYRIDMLADVVQRVSDNKRFIANAGDSDQKMPMTQQSCVASNDLFVFAELPITLAQHDHHLAAIRNLSP